MEKKNKGVPEDLIGFKEFIEFEEKKKGRASGRQVESNFQHLSFLETESVRLGKTIDLCEEQTFTLNNYPQENNIRAKQNQIINKNRMIIVELLRRKDSPLTKNLRDLLRIHFG